MKGTKKKYVNQVQVVKRNAMLELQNVVMNENGRNYRNDNFHFPVGLCLNRIIHIHICLLFVLFCIFIEATKIDQIRQIAQITYDEPFNVLLFYFNVRKLMDFELILFLIFTLLLFFFFTA